MRSNLIVVYLLVFLALLILLRTLNVIEINNEELLGYVLIISGLSLFYSSFINNKKIILFTGSVTFLCGILFFVIGNFEFQDTDKLIIPAIILILSFGSFMLYLSDTAQKIMLYLSIILFTAGIGAIALIGTQGMSRFFDNVIFIGEKYWPVPAILIVVIILVNREYKN